MELATRKQRLLSGDLLEFSAAWLVGGVTEAATSRRNSIETSSCFASARSAASYTNGGNPALSRSASCASAKLG